MKRLAFIFSALLIVASSLSPLATTTHAQTGDDLIVLNDSTPGIDVVVNPSPDTTGVIALEIDNASVMVTDAVGNVVFESADASIEGIEFSFAPNAGTHTVTVERLPGAIQSYARIASQVEMTSPDNTPQLVNTSTLAMDQEADYPLNADSPSSQVDFAVPEATASTVTARFPGAPVTAQLVDTTADRSLATLTGSLIDGVRFTVTDGTYELLLLNNNTERNTVANVQVTAAPQSDFETLVAQADASDTTTMANTAPASNGASAVAATCTFTVNASSVNVRSGPGTGYSVLNYAFRGDSLAVGGVSDQSDWLLVGTNDGSGWVSGNLGGLEGSCANLAAFDIPYREAATPQVTFQQSEVPVYHDDDGYDDEYDDYEDDDSYDDGYEDHEEDDHSDDEHEEPESGDHDDD